MLADVTAPVVITVALGNRSQMPIRPGTVQPPVREQHRRVALDDAPSAVESTRFKTPRIASEIECTHEIGAGDCLIDNVVHACIIMPLSIFVNNKEINYQLFPSKIGLKISLLES